MSRPSMLLMSAGAGVLLIGLVLLWQSTRSDAPPIEPTVAPPVATTPAAPPPSSAARPRKITPPPPSAPAAPRAVHSEHAPSMPALPAAVPDARPPLVLSDRNLQYGATQLHAQTAAVEPLIKACIAKANGKPSGTAYLNYVVTKRDDKVVIEETGVEPSGTTLEDETLLDCLHKTANGMKFVGLPRDAASIMATRRITIENGTLKENKHVTFTYLR